MVGWFRSRHDIDTRLFAALRQRLDRFQAHVKELPQYRFVDVYRAAEHHCRATGITATIESDHRNEYLSTILHSRPSRRTSRRVGRSERIAWSTGPGEEVFLPVDVFWICAGSDTGRAPLVVRVHYDANRERTVVEAACPDAPAAERFVTEVVRRSEAASIYRNRVLALRFEPASRDEFGDVEKPERLRVLFAPEPELDDGDVVMDEAVRRLLWRNVIDLQMRRDVLKAHGVPIRRGILLHGPPGTGKSFACRYLCAKLPNTTRIVVAGSALQQVPAVFALARMLQPALVILEDVDLVFTMREINAQASILGELLDQMDGLRPHEDVGFVLTTNAIDRIEAAIKDRPGRISQCIHLGPPGAELRKRYLLHYLAPYAAPGVDVESLASRSSGATQAFLKDWVHRAVQIATERLGSAADKLELRGEDFETAIREARSSAQGTSGRIIGFLGEPLET
jgi:ATPase family associated with various cellular activities (AAA)